MTPPYHTAPDLIIISENFAPSSGATAQLVSDLADYLHNQSFNIRIITSTPGSIHKDYPVTRLAPFHQISTFFLAKKSIIGKILTGTIFLLGSLMLAPFQAKPSTIFLIVSNPPFIGVLGLILKATKGYRYIFLLQDIFPRSAILSGVMPSRGILPSFWCFIMKLVLNSSEKTIVLSQSMTARCSLDFGSPEKLVCIPNWSLFQSEVFTPPKPKSQSLLIQYSGNFGRLHDILTILEAARLVSDLPIHFQFIGDGPKKIFIKSYIDRLSLPNVSLRSLLPLADLSNSISTCDLSIVSLVPGAEDTVAPSKLYGILSAGRPVLLISSYESELSALLAEKEIGWSVQSGDSLELANRLIYLYKNPQELCTAGYNAFVYYQQECGRDRSLSSYKRILLNVLHD